MMIKKLLLVLISVLAFISCDKDEEKLDNKEALIENLDLFQTNWSGMYTDEFNQVKIQLSFYEKGLLRCVMDSDSDAIYSYNHVSKIIYLSSTYPTDIDLSGSWWIVDITENYLLLQRGIDGADPNALDVLELTKVS